MRISRRLTPVLLLGLVAVSQIGYAGGSGNSSAKAWAHESHAKGTFTGTVESRFKMSRLDVRGSKSESVQKHEISREGDQLTVRALMHGTGESMTTVGKIVESAHHTDGSSTLRVRF